MRSQRINRRGLFAVASVTAGALTLVGCSGIASGNNGNDSTVAATGAQICGPTISIGAALPFSGPFQEFGTNSYNGAQVAVDEINAAGGIKSLGGAKLQLIKGDVSSTDTGQATTAATQLVQQGVIAMTGAWLSAQSVPVSAVAQSSKVPLVSQSFADALSANGNEYYFQPIARSSAVGGGGVQLMIDAAKAAGITYKKADVILPNDVANQTQGNAAVAALNAAGVPTPAATFYTVGLTDATPLVNKVKQDNPDLIITGGSPADAALIVKAIRGAGITALLSSFGGGIPEPSFAASLGNSAVNGIMDVTVWSDDLPYDGVAAASTAYQKLSGQPFMPFEAGATWAGVHDIAAALESETTPSCSPADLATALHALDLSSGPGAAVPGGALKFAPGGYNTAAVPVLVQWQDGKLVTVAPTNLAKGKMIKG